MRVSKHKKPGNESTVTHKEILKRLYEQGYLCKPESVKEVKALEKLSAEALCDLNLDFTVELR